MRRLLVLHSTCVSVAHDWCSTMYVVLGCRLGTHNGAIELKSHPFFKDLDWDSLRGAKAPNIPALEHELDTQNFENFDEEGGASDGGAKRWRKGADPDFVCFTYKNMKAVNRDEGAVAFMLCDY